MYDIYIEYLINRTSNNSLKHYIPVWHYARRTQIWQNKYYWHTFSTVCWERPEVHFWPTLYGVILTY